MPFASAAAARKLPFAAVAAHSAAAVAALHHLWPVQRLHLAEFPSAEYRLPSDQSLLKFICLNTYL
jgi:hypothetical protein